MKGGESKTGVPGENHVTHAMGNLSHWVSVRRSLTKVALSVNTPGFFFEPAYKIITLSLCSSMQNKPSCTISPSLFEIEQRSEACLLVSVC